MEEERTQDEIARYADVGIIDRWDGSFTTTVVIKVGGSCLADGPAIRVVVDRIAEIRGRGITPVIVVSALKGMTDALLDVAMNANGGHDPRLVDRIVAEGEQLSARILQTACESAGVQARAVLLADPVFPVITDDRHGRAKPLLEETERRSQAVLGPLLADGIVPIVPGFVGMTMAGEITTLGRGGSDTTAVLLGRALHAREIVLVKDVPGVCSADARTVDDVRTLPEMSVEEAAELAAHGGEVICPGSLAYKPADVPVRVVGLDAPDLLAGGTLITGELRSEVRVEVVGEELAAVTVVGKGIGNERGLLGRCTGALADVGIDVVAVSTSGISLSLYLDPDSMHAATQALHHVVLDGHRLSSVTARSGLVSLSVTGLDVGRGAISAIYTALAREGIEVVDLTTRPSHATVVVDSRDAEQARESLAGAFAGNGPRTSLLVPRPVAGPIPS